MSHPRGAVFRSAGQDTLSTYTDSFRVSIQDVFRGSNSHQHGRGPAAKVEVGESCGSRVCTPVIGLCFSNGYSGDLMTSLVAQMVKNLPAVQGTWVRSPGGEDPLEEEMATQSSIVAWKIPWTEGSVGSQSRTRLDDSHTHTHTHTHTPRVVGSPTASAAPHLHGPHSPGPSGGGGP